VIDGVPLLVGPLAEYVQQQLLALVGRDDLAADLESLLGDCAGPGSPYDATRQHLSIYGASHFGDLVGPAPEEPVEGLPELLDRALEVLGPLPPGPVLDAGCAAGRASFEVARRTAAPVLGVDLHFALLRLGAAALRTGRVRFPRRRVGLVYERQELAASFPGAPRVDFWAADAQALPFADGTFGLVLSLNLLDCTGSPRDHLAEVVRVLAPGGKAVVTTPFDWSSAAAPPGAWLGGHSQRNPRRGASEGAVEALFAPGDPPAAIPGARITTRRDGIPWRLATHDRSTVVYRLALWVLERTG
jgi:SAM-dependent methyltransferase